MGRKRITFVLRAPKARQVYVAGSFNGWDPAGRPMKSDGDGLWSARMTLEPGVHQYRFRVDGKWVDDPECEDREENECGTPLCVVRV
jgi:1,4-alpha-glucan branching enzyme